MEKIPSPDVTRKTPDMNAIIDEANRLARESLESIGTAADDDKIRQLAPGFMVAAERNLATTSSEEM